ncbi:MAG: 16S rRNA (cytosine(1402)-N(4))-methyltransferase [Candidatus Magasanikbacteria bacterium RIFCSPHIGHO2_02_FULL_50_9b]|uniref:Ribosomal RNA small subunit methyltransferase H n=1 Tax=Candidatus Magasanikbacteria bacterium RIFCSPHIGHO2_02_FULL_50_9b TaxID=1798682 RepID=A0A1F6M8Y4_9BACT|nr:MAG: 16S rRNA (cytosine(1402)-N(4))-methyltransferase [Candidatus Magasanikbacteria bacterium RIFCSPHIGHO2_02_FULL_50_9b]
MEPISFHRPVLLGEVREWLSVRPGMVVVDGTLGDGGHSELLCELVGPTGLVIGIDRDPEAIPLVEQRLTRFSDRFLAVNGNFKDLPELVATHTVRPIDRVLLDLGWSTTQFVTRGRGFSFMTNEQLDMRFNPSENTESAGDIVNTASLRELIRIFRLYGEERRAEQIAEAIVAAREREPITTTQQLANIVVSVAPRVGAIHPATQVFQALRIAVNDELAALREALNTITTAIPHNARVAIITFHSLEDRIVKRFISTRTDVKAITKKPIIPTEDEIRDNPRSRSSKLRIFEKV